MLGSLADFIDPLDEDEERLRAIRIPQDEAFLDALNPQRVRDREAAAAAVREKHLGEVRQRAADYRAQRHVLQRQPLPLGPVSERIIKMVASYFNIAPAVVIGKDRKSLPVSARHVAIRLLRDQKNSEGLPRFSLPVIGRLLGGRDHSTISHGLHGFEDRARKYPEMLEAYAFVKGALDG